MNGSEEEKKIVSRGGEGRVGGRYLHCICVVNDVADGKAVQVGIDDRVNQGEDCMIIPPTVLHLLSR